MKRTRWWWWLIRLETWLGDTQLLLHSTKLSKLPIFIPKILKSTRSLVFFIKHIIITVTSNLSFTSNGTFFLLNSSPGGHSSNVGNIPSSSETVISWVVNKNGPNIADDDYCFDKCLPAPAYSTLLQPNRQHYSEEALPSLSGSCWWLINYQWMGVLSNRFDHTPSLTNYGSSCKDND